MAWAWAITAVVWIMVLFSTNPRGERGPHVALAKVMLSIVLTFVIWLIWFVAR